jgi:phosphatidylglycerophosphatase GEP4
MMRWNRFEGLVCDADNTILDPYSNNEVHPTVEKSFNKAKELYGPDNILIVSNHAGTGDDSGEVRAITLEEKLGVPVLRHKWKKPFGGKAAIRYFTKVLGKECDPRKLIMIGDHPLTDIVFGNRYGMITILVEELVPKKDNKLQTRMKRYIKPLMKEWKSKGKRAPRNPNYTYNICNGGCVH